MLCFNEFDIASQKEARTKKGWNYHIRENSQTLKLVEKKHKVTSFFLPPWNQLCWVTAPTWWNILIRRWASFCPKNKYLWTSFFSKIAYQCNNFSKSLGQVIELTILLQQSLTLKLPEATVQNPRHPIQSVDSAICRCKTMSSKKLPNKFRSQKTIPWYPLCFAMTHWSKPKPKHIPHWDPQNSHLNLPPDQNSMSFQSFCPSKQRQPQSIQQDSPVDPLNS